ncbi:MAG: DUF1887 family CARF protein [Acidobacteriota bacterium]
MKIHVAIVSEQTLANLIPILMERPDKVYLVCSDEMRQRGLDGRIKNVLAKEAIGVDTKCGVPSAGLQSIYHYARSLAAEIGRDHPGADIVLNATGGTKLMSLGFVEVFRASAQRILYTDTSHRRIEILPDGAGTAFAPIQMRDVLDIPGYLAAQGFHYQGARSDQAAWRARVASRQGVCHYLGSQVGMSEIQRFIGTLNWLAKEALGEQSRENDDALPQPKQYFPDPPRGERATAMTRMAGAGLVGWSKGDRQIRFTSADAARFLCGGWLEEYAWQAAQQESAWDARCSITVTAEDAPDTRNEFDVLACHSNEMLVLECKTLRYQEGNDSKTAYKIDSLGQQLRGLFGETWLLSARPPTDALLQRARLARIRIIGPAELPQLRSAIRQWMKPSLDPEPASST